MAYLRLCRIGNVFTSFADVLMGYTVAHGALDPSATLLCLLLTSGLAYTAGMVLNDWFDAERDQLLRPDRPIPAGWIARRVAGRLGWGLLLASVVAAGLASAVSSWHWGPLGLAALLAVCIVLYDGWLKSSAWGPWAMGACRGTNVLLGMSTLAPLTTIGHDGLWLPAAGMAVYVSGITLFARGEAVGGSRTPLVTGTACMLAGVVVLGAVYRFTAIPRQFFLPNELAWWCLLLLVGFPVARRSLAAIATPEPVRIQRTVGLAITTLVVLDASVALLMGGTVPAIVTVSMLFPAMLIMRWIPPT